MIEKIKKYWWHEGHFNENQRDFFIEILSKIKPKSVLEIGFASGRSCCTVLIAAEPEKMISIDINLDSCDARKNANNLTSDFKNLKIIEGDSKKILTKDFLTQEFPKGLDFVFVDGGHSYEDAFNDMINTYEFINSGGVMIVDDFNSGPPDGCSIPDVNRAVEDFSKKFQAEYSSYYNSGKGCAIFYKK